MEVEVTVLNEKNKEPLFDVDIFDANIRIPGTDQYKDLGITNPQGIKMPRHRSGEVIAQLRLKSQIVPSVSGDRNGERVINNNAKNVLN